MCVMISIEGEGLENEDMVRLVAYATFQRRDTGVILAESDFR